MKDELNRKCFITAVTACLVLTAFPLSAEPQKEEASPEARQSVTLTLDKAVEYALENSRTLKTADIDLEVKKRSTDNSWNILLPTMQLNGTMSRATEFNPSSSATPMMINAVTGGQLPVQTDFEDEESRWSVIGGFSFSWNFSIAYIQQIRASHASFENQLISFEQTQKETELNVKKLFYGLLLQRESLNIQRTTLENARNRAIQAETNYKNGSIPELSLLQAQVSYENMKPEVEQAQRAYRQNLDMLALVLGLPVGTDIKLEGKIEPVYINTDYDSLLQKYGSNSLDLKALDKNIDLLKLNLSALNLSRFVPAFVFNYSWQPVYIGGKAFGFPGDIGSNDKWYDSGSLSLTLAWNLTNLLPWSSSSQQLTDLKSTLEKMEINRELLSENQKIEVRKAVDTLKESRAQITSMGRNITLAQKAYDATLKAYRSGTTELLDLRDAENSLNQAKLGQMNQKFNYITALLDLEKTLNTKLTE